MGVAEHPAAAVTNVLPTPGALASVSVTVELPSVTASAVPTAVADVEP